MSCFLHVNLCFNSLCSLSKMSYLHGKLHFYRLHRLKHFRGNKLLFSKQGRKIPMESRCGITAVNTFLSSFPSSIILCPSHRKRQLSTLDQAPTDSFLNPDTWMWSTEKLLLSSSGKEGNASVPCLFTFPACQKRSESEDYTARPE